MLPDLDLVAVLREVCRREGYTLELIDPGCGRTDPVSADLDLARIDPVFGFLLRVSCPQGAFVTGAGDLCAWPINRATPLTLARDKARAAALLVRAGVPVPRGRAFLLTDRYGPAAGRGQSRRDAPAYAEELGYPVVVKPNQGSLGRCVDLVGDAGQLDRSLREIGLQQPLGLVQEWVRGEEFRILLLDGRPQYAYRKSRARLSGDGRSTVEALLDRENARLHAAGTSRVRPDSVWLREQLAKRDLTLGDVLGEGDALEYAFRRNVHGSGGVDDVRTGVPELLGTLCARTAAALDLRVCGLDVVLPSGMADPAAACVLEVNANPWISALYRSGHEERIHELWTKVCRIYFSEPLPATPPASPGPRPPGAP